MSLSTTGIVTGACLSLYGAYKYVRGNEQQKKTALLCMAVGIAAIAAGAISLKQLSEVVQNTVQSAPVVEPVCNIEGIETCSINALKDILNKGGGNSTTSRIFNILNETQGISCENFLSWKGEFHFGGTGYIDGIKASHLQKAVQWGIDQWSRPYIAIKYLCDKTSEGAVTLFQRYSNFESTWVKGGHFEAPNCYLKLGDALNQHNYTALFENLKTLLKSGELIGKNKWMADETTVLTLLNA